MIILKKQNFKVVPGPKTLYLSFSMKIWQYLLYLLQKLLRNKWEKGLVRFSLSLKEKETADLVTFTEEILWWKTSFFGQ